MKLLETFSEVFWDPSFWLPPNTTWEQFERSEPGSRTSTTADLFLAWKLVPILLVLKFTFEKNVGTRLVAWAGLTGKPREKPPPIEILEKAYHLNPKCKWDQQQLTAFSKQLDWSEREINQWFSARRTFGKPTLAQKVGESSWRFVFFVSIFSYGVWAHWTKPWFWDFKLCWENFPQPVTEDLYWYYIISFANYSSWSISHFWDVQRKDPRVMMFHHFITLTLLSVQWIQRFHRVGLLICLLHDLGDFLLELSKSLKYLGFEISARLMLILFTITWILARNVIFPFYLITSIYEHSLHGIPQQFPFSCLHGPCCISSFKFTATHVLLVCSSILSLLHVYWTFLILQVIYRVAVFGDTGDDTVSDTEDDEMSDKTDSEKSLPRSSPKGPKKLS